MVGKNIKFLRKQAKLSQIELAIQLDITERTIYNYEVGKQSPKPKILEKIADVLYIDASDLISKDLEKEFSEGKLPTFDIRKQQFATSSPVKNHKAEAYFEEGDSTIGDLLEQTTALFAGGKLSEQAKDDFFESVTQAYFLAKRKSKLKNNS